MPERWSPLRRTTPFSHPSTISPSGGRLEGLRPPPCEARIHGICDAIDPDPLDEVAVATTIVECAPGEVFSHEGEPQHYLFNVVSGSVKLSKALPNGRRQIVGFLTIGDFIGYGRPSRSTCSAQALSPLRLCRIEYALLETHPDLAQSLLTAAADAVAAAYDHVALLGRMTAAERVARFLLRQAAAARGIGRAAGELDLPMTRLDVADYLGLTVETVSRILTALRRRKVIAYDNVRSVTLCDLAELERLAEGR